MPDPEQMDLDAFGGNKAQQAATVARRKGKSPKTTIIYEPRGRAGEYAALAANLYTGCDHGCGYCWGPRLLHLTKEEFMRARPRSEDIIEKFRRECEILSKAGEKRSILLMFTSDPYCCADLKHKLTRQAIEILNEYNLHFTILSKGGMRVRRDYDLIRQAGERATVATKIGRAHV